MRHRGRGGQCRGRRYHPNRLARRRLHAENAGDRDLRHLRALQGGVTVSMMVSSPASHHVTRPLDAVAAAIVVVLCLSWGFNQVAAKLAIHDIPPMIQAAIRSLGAALIVAAWCRLRGVPLLSRDGTLTAGLIAGAMFGIEFILIYRG